MKRVFSILILTIAALATFTISAQTLEGEWVGAEQKVEGEEDAVMIPKLKFKKNGTGSMIEVTNFDALMEDDFHVKARIIASVPFVWSMNGDNIEIVTDAKKCSVDLKDFTVKTGDSAVDFFIGLYKREIGNEIKNQMREDIADRLLNQTVNWEIESLTDNKLVVREEGDTVVFTREKK